MRFTGEASTSIDLSHYSKINEQWVLPNAKCEMRNELRLLTPQLALVKIALRLKASLSFSFQITPRGHGRPVRGLLLFIELNTLMPRHAVKHPPPTRGALLNEPTRKGGAPIGGDSEINGCAKKKAMLVNEIPQDPFPKGASGFSVGGFTAKESSDAGTHCLL